MSRILIRCVDTAYCLVVSVAIVGLLVPSDALLAGELAASDPEASILPPLPGELDLFLKSAQDLPDAMELSLTDGRSFNVSRVPEGYQISEVGSLDGPRLLRWQDIQGLYLASVEDVSNDHFRFTLGQRKPLGGTNLLSVDTELLSPTDLKATFSDGDSVLNAMTIRTSEPLDYQQSGPLPEKFVIVIVLSAAAVGAIACALVAWATNCLTDCAESCSQCGGSMESATEGYCGTCTCTCIVPQPTFFHRPEDAQCDP